MFSACRTLKNLKEAEVDVGGIKLKVAVVNGLKATQVRTSSLLCGCGCVSAADGVEGGGDERGENGAKGPERGR